MTLAMSQSTLKVVTTIGIFFLTLVAALLPYKLRASKRFLSVCNVFAGGIFLAAGLCHLLADSAEQFNEYYEHHDHDDHDHPEESLKHGDENSAFPWAFCMAGIGFLSTLIIEQIAHHLTHSSESKHSFSKDQQETLLHDGDYIADSSLNTNDASGDPLQPRLMATPENSFHSHFSDHSHNHNHQHEHDHDHDHHHDDDHGHSHVPMSTKNQSFIVVIALWLALSFHSIVEGISLGSSHDDTLKSVAVAILAHKGLESFSLGTSLVNSSASILRYISFCFLFACMTPLGVLIGSLISSSTEGLVSAFICGFAAGTFTYVAIVEVIIPEFKKQQDILFKIIAVSIGFGFMALLAIWV